MNTQEKFQAAMQQIADDRDLDLVIEHNYSNTGFYSFQPRHGFEPVLRFPFYFHAGYSGFGSRGRTAGPLGKSPKGGPWSHVEGGEHELVIARVRAVLDGEPDTVRTVLLPHGGTVPLTECSVYEVQAAWSEDEIRKAIKDGSLDGRELR
jgi:hypothetical protein